MNPTRRIQKIRGDGIFERNSFFKLIYFCYIFRTIHTGCPANVNLPKNLEQIKFNTTTVPIGHSILLTCDFKTPLYPRENSKSDTRVSTALYWFNDDGKFKAVDNDCNANPFIPFRFIDRIIKTANCNSTSKKIEFTIKYIRKDEDCWKCTLPVQEEETMDASERGKDEFEIYGGFEVYEMEKPPIPTIEVSNSNPGKSEFEYISEEDSQVMMQCVYHKPNAEPIQRILWIIKRELVPRKTLYNQKLVIEKVSVNDTGNYWCGIENEKGHAYSKPIKFKIIAQKPKPKDKFLPTTKNDEIFIYAGIGGGGFFLLIILCIIIIFLCKKRKRSTREPNDVISKNPPESKSENIYSLEMKANNGRTTKTDDVDEPIYMNESTEGGSSFYVQNIWDRDAGDDQDDIYDCVQDENNFKVVHSEKDELPSYAAVDFDRQPISKEEFEEQNRMKNNSNEIITDEKLLYEDI